MSDFWYTFNVLLSFVLGIGMGVIACAVYIEHRDKKRERENNGNN